MHVIRRFFVSVGASFQLSAFSSLPGGQGRWSRTAPLGSGMGFVAPTLDKDQGQFRRRRYGGFKDPSELKRMEKLRTMGRNPVRRGLVEKAEDWPWSSFVHYVTGAIGTVEIDSEWTARLCVPLIAIKLR